jgi:RNA polymerase sigma-70 factor (ECF subfamily)
LLALPDDQREALILVGGSGFAYEEAAEICGVAVGTIKSRVSRARGKLVQILELHPAPDLGPDAAPEARFAAGGRR